MSISTLTPRLVEDLDDSVSAVFDESLFAAAESGYGPAACVSTCVSGFTVVCDGNTFNRTCVTGFTLRCDG